MTTPIAEELETKLRTFRYSAFRLETLQCYRGSGEDEAIAAFGAGRPAPADEPAQTEWEAMIRSHRRAGRVMQRVRVVVEPVTDYLKFELTWAYSPNVAAGEDVRIVPVGRSDWPEDLPRHDFWLFDSSEVFDAQYADDGTWLGVVAVTDPAAIVAACRWRDAALHHAQSWQTYISARPALAARLPAVM